ncbi:MAG: DNA-binding response regulator, partial [Betaproteobacteria bacterium]|nr:DNA-binding response regulator [Betaproteobacteria bacterium]
MPDGDGFSLLADWRGRYPEMRVVIISASEQPGEIMRALEEGAAGFIPKRTAIEVLVHALRMVMSGGIYVPPLALKTGVAAAGPAPSRTCPRRSRCMSRRRSKALITASTRPGGPAAWQSNRRPPPQA